MRLAGGTGQLLIQSSRGNCLTRQIRRRQVSLAPTAQTTQKLLRHGEGAAGRRSRLIGGHSLLCVHWLLL